jgi:hypothetical protein
MIFRTAMLSPPARDDIRLPEALPTTLRNDIVELHIPGFMGKWLRAALDCMADADQSRPQPPRQPAQISIVVSRTHSQPETLIVECNKR